ncbi:hypothetical protein QWT69_04345 [Sporosarcina oncorhynchi]|uniref:Uncharacterized protein n=1 Tax=Sporosarcina oncorhynchi TaxID=3056444 RepID=A0ABZ0L723_9BACL|nr:hypothetical protein [Sporosarcina sp. T2O-4]WOV88360.1 hypothetical protein QWT69_04345 [Sporosarcina sp. T2O-4]
MKLIIGEQHKDYAATPTAEEVIEHINEHVTEGFHFSHIIVDGEEVYDDHEEYLEEHLASIEQLEVIIKSEKEFMNDVLLSAEEYLIRANPEVTAVAKAFQGVPTQDSWEQFEMLLGGAGWLSDMLKIVSSSKERPTNWKAYKDFAGNLHSELSKLGKAVEKKKNNEISKVIKQGVLPIFERLQTELGKTIDSEFTRKNLN